MFRKAVLNEEIDFWCRNLQLCPCLFHSYHMTKKVCRFRHQKSISSFKTALRNILKTQGCSDNKCSCFLSWKCFIHLLSKELVQNFSTCHVLSLWSCDSSCNWMRPTLIVFSFVVWCTGQSYQSRTIAQSLPKGWRERNLSGLSNILITCVLPLLFSSSLLFFVIALFWFPSLKFPLYHCCLALCSLFNHHRLSSPRPLDSFPYPTFAAHLLVFLRLPREPSPMPVINAFLSLSTDSHAEPSFVSCISSFLI